MTALQELINKWEIEKGSYIPNAPIYQAFIEEAKQVLVKEKQQIINAFEDGDNNFSLTRQIDNGEEYFNNKFNQIQR